MTWMTELSVSHTATGKPNRRSAAQERVCPTWSALRETPAAAAPSAVSETATASDTIAAQLANQTYAATVLESVTASDTIVGTVPTVYAAAVIETISISDIAGATVTNPSTFWTQIGTTQSAGWGQINNTQSSGWTIIPTT